MEQTEEKLYDLTAKLEAHVARCEERDKTIFNRLDNIERNIRTTHLCLIGGNGGCGYHLVVGVALMPLTKLQFKPGINKENTSYSNEGGWRDSDKIRFRFGVPEKIGGWQKDTAKTFLGTCRALKAWVSLAGTSLLGVGTNNKYYIKKGSDYNDITPTRVTTSSGDLNFAATTNSQTITITDASHGAVTGDFV